jgi:hypothetical protein
VTEPAVDTAAETIRVGEKEPEASPSVSELNAIDGEPGGTVTVVFRSTTAASAEVGTWAGDQFAAVNQLLSVPPTQLMVAARTEIGRQKRRTAKAALLFQRTLLRILGVLCPYR